MQKNIVVVKKKMQNLKEKGKSREYWKKMVLNICVLRFNAYLCTRI